MNPNATVHKVRTSRLPTYKISTDSLGSPRQNAHQVIKGINDIDARLSLTSIDMRQGRRFLMTLQINSKDMSPAECQQLLKTVFEFLASRGLIAESKIQKLLDSAATK